MRPSTVAIHAPPQLGLPTLSLAALGVVFGDIGTSPLYTLKTVLDVTGSAQPAAILGSLSLILWTLIIVTSLKYVTLALRVRGAPALHPPHRPVRRSAGVWRCHDYAGHLGHVGS